MHLMNNEGAMNRGCGIVTIGSTRQTDLEASTALVNAALLDAGHQVTHQRSVSAVTSDVRYLFRDWVDDARIDVIVSLGSVGVTSRDIAPEALSPLMTKNMPGFGEAYRQMLYSELGLFALETRAMAAVCHSTIAYLLPEDPAAVKIALSKLILPQLAERLSPKSLRPSSMPQPRIPVAQLVK